MNGISSINGMGGFNGLNGAAGFDMPWVLPVFLVFIPLAALDLVRRKGELEAARYFFRHFRFRCLASGICFHLFLACMIIALAGPRWGSRTVSSYRRGLDLVIALDLSRSMEVRDAAAYPRPAGAPVSRLDRSLALAGELVNRSGGIRMGFALGRSRGILALPLTYDTEGLLGFLEGLGGAAITGRGTNLETLVDAAAGAFQDSFPGRRGIVLFSDGEALSGSLIAALDRAREAGIVVNILGMGSDEGGPVPPAGEDPLSDEPEPVILSFRQSAFLRDAAAHTGGIYLDGNRDDAAAALSAYLGSLAAGTGPGASRREPGTWWHTFVIAGLIFWGLSRCLGLRRRSSRGVLPDD